MISNPLCPGAMRPLALACLLSCLAVSAAPALAQADAPERRAQAPARVAAPGAKGAAEAARAIGWTFRTSTPAA